MSLPAPRQLDTACLARMIETHQADLWRYVRYLGASADEADDLVQETFLAVFRSSFAEQDDRQTASYLRTAARRQLLMLRRRQSRDGQQVDLKVAEAVWAETFSIGHVNPYLDALADCVAELNGRAKQAIDLHYHQQTSREEIANKLDIKPEGVKTLLRRTRDALRTCVERRLVREAEH